MRRVKWMLVVGALTLLDGCGCAGQEFTVRRTFHVHAEATDALCQSDRVEVNLGEDQAFTDVRAFISTVELRQLAVEVVAPKTREDSVVTKAHGTVQLAASGTDTTLTLGTYGDVPVAAGSRQDIAIDQAAAKALTRLALDSPNVFFVGAEGCNDAVPAFYDFDVIMTLYAGL